VLKIDPEPHRNFEVQRDTGWKLQSGSVPWLRVEWLPCA